MKKYLKKNQKGFTLIEIIAVLIILGILATIAIGKFMDLQEQAQAKAIEGALAEGMSACNVCFGKLALSTSNAPDGSEVAACATANPPASEDFSYSFTTNGNNVTVQVDTSWDDPNDTVTKDWINPNTPTT